MSTARQFIRIEPDTGFIKNSNASLINTWTLQDCVGFFLSSESSQRSLPIGDEEPTKHLNQIVRGKVMTRLFECCGALPVFEIIPGENLLEDQVKDEEISPIIEHKKTSSPIVTVTKIPQLLDVCSKKMSEIIGMPYPPAAISGLPQPNGEEYFAIIFACLVTYIQTLKK